MKNKLIIVLFTLTFILGCSSKKKTSNHDVSRIKVVTLDKEKKPSEGQNLYEANCAKCHSLYDKSSFSADEWKPIVLRMQKQAKITDEQRENIYAYLITP